MIERRTITTKPDTTRPAEAAAKSGNGAQPPPLQQQIAAALRSDTTATAAELQALIAAVSSAIAEARNTIEQERAKALDPFDPADPASAQQRLLIAQLTHDRLQAALPHLMRQLAAVQRREDGERWSANYERLAAVVEAAAEKFARYQHWSPNWSSC